MKAIVAVLLVFASCEALRKDWIKVDPVSHFYKDSFGRLRIFRGQNYVKKGFPWYPVEMMNDTIIQDMADWGFNTMRLGTMWTGIEPVEGQWNETYIGIIKDIVGRLYAKGIYAFLDMHQDCMSARFGMYEGFPNWLVDKGNSSRPEHAWPYPWSESPPAWGDNCLTQAEDHAWGLFYGNYKGMRDAHVRVWGKIAAEFKDVEGVLAYELINEPFAGDVWGDPLLFLPGEAGRKSLMPLYDAISPTIRAVDDDTVIMFEPVTWGMLFNSQVISSGFTSVPGGPAYADRSVFSYHYYCWVYDQNGPSGLQKGFCKDLMGPDVFEAVRRDVQIQGGGSMMTEWGQCNLFPEGPDAFAQCTNVMNEADAFMQSYTYWDGNFYYPNGTRDMERIRAFARPYPQATAGLPVSMLFNADHGAFNFVFKPNTSITAPTEIVVPRLHFNGRPRVTTCAGTAPRLLRNGTIVAITYTGAPVASPCEVNIYAM